MTELAPGSSDVAPGGAAAAPGAAAVAGCGTWIAALANGGRVAGTPVKAAAKFCNICGALAAELTSCCPMSGIGSGGVGSALADPSRPATTSAAGKPTATALARNNVHMGGMVLPGGRRQVSAQ
jgi:hypothetical protein